jgi:signal transduction histidine kinase
MDEMIERPFRQTAIALLNDFRSIDDHVDAPQLKDQILAVVAHELRGPLSPLRLASHLIRRASADRPEVLRSIDMIDRQTTQIARLADDLMDVTRAG